MREQRRQRNFENRESTQHFESRVRKQLRSMLAMPTTTIQGSYRRVRTSVRDLGSTVAKFEFPYSRDHSECESESESESGSESGSEPARNHLKPSEAF